MGVEWGGGLLEWGDDTAVRRLKLVLLLAVTVLVLLWLAETNQDSVDDGRCTTGESCMEREGSGR